MAVSKWTMKGEAIGACSCDWGCPCNFDAPLTNGWCEGGYTMHINEGSADGVKLDGLTFSILGHSPQAVHLGNATWYLLLDEKATPEQREKLESIVRGEVGGPFASSLASVGPRVAKTSVERCTLG